MRGLYSTAVRGHEGAAPSKVLQELHEAEHMKKAEHVAMARPGQPYGPPKNETLQFLVRGVETSPFVSHCMLLLSIAKLGKVHETVEIVDFRLIYVQLEVGRSG